MGGVTDGEGEDGGVLKVGGQRGSERDCVAMRQMY